MKDRETQLAFIKARAEGKSYSTISKELGIAKATCTSWEQSLKGDIDALRQAQLDELYTAYSMKREARIKTLGGIVQGLDSAIAGKNLDELPADKLLELRLKYGRELRGEYVEPVEPEADNTLDWLLEQYNKLYIESRAGNITPADLKAQMAILNAKQDILYNIASEQRKEEESPFDMSLDYRSRIIRHGKNRQGA